MIDLLLLDDAADRLRGVTAALGLRDGPRRVEAVLPDLLREADDALLLALAQGLGGLLGDAAAVRVLETLARRGGPVRVAALRALRGEASVARLGASAVAPAPPAAASPLAEAVSVADGSSSALGAASPQPTGGPAAEAPGPGAPLRSASWSEPFEVVLADPAPARLSQAALALVDLAERRPADATREALQALAGRLAMASFDHEGEVQAGLARLARGLKALG